MKRLILFGLCLSVGVLFAANPVKISYTYNYLSNDRNESQALAEQHAIERAKQKALELRFGVNVSSIIVSMEHETSGNGKFHNDEDFFSLGSTVARGEWVESISEKILESHHNGEYWQVRVFIEGTAREKTGTPIDIKYAFVNNTHDRENRTSYYDNDDIFLRFSSPVDGNLCVYLVDAEKEAYCLLPYSNNGTGSQLIKANKEYTFFNPESDKDANPLVLTTEKKQELNVLYVLFSPNALTKAKDNKSGTNWRQQEMPRSLSYDEFVRWLAKNQTSDEQLQVYTEVITIRQR